MYVCVAERQLNKSEKTCGLLTCYCIVSLSITDLVSGRDESMDESQLAKETGNADGGTTGRGETVIIEVL